MLEEGSLTAHVVIVARAMGVPVLGRVRKAARHRARGRRAAARCRQGRRACPPQPAGARPVRRTHREQPRAPGGLCRAARCRAVHPRRHAHPGDDERRPARRHGEPAADGRGRHRAVPHRIPVPRLGHAALARTADAALSRRARGGGRQAGDLPHGRYRRRQGAALPRQRAAPTRTRTRRWAGARCASRSSAKGC